MILLLLVLVCFLAWKAEWVGFNPGYISRSQTTSWKGFFAVIILFSHFLGYVALDSPLDTSFRYVVSRIGQMMVVPFLFYSGYGVMESFSIKPDYSDNFLRKRFLPTWLHFCFAVLLFVVVQGLLGNNYPRINYILCWTGWEGIGNSNWFVFDILVLYLITKASFCLSSFFKDSPKGCAIITLVFTLLFWGIMRYGFGEKGAWWYNTLWTYPLGMLFSVYRSRLVPALIGEKPETKRVLWCSLAALLLFGLCSTGRSNGLLYNFKSCFFAMFITFLSMKLVIGNSVLEWLGRHCFSIYILQRLPMIVMSHFGMNTQHLHLFAVLVVLSTLALAAGFTWFTDKFDAYVFGKGRIH